MTPPKFNKLRSTAGVFTLRDPRNGGGGRTERGNKPPAEGDRGFFFVVMGRNDLGGNQRHAVQLLEVFRKRIQKFVAAIRQQAANICFFLKFLGGSDLFLMSKLRGTDFLPFATFDAQLVSSSFDPEVASRTSSTT